MLCWRVRWEIKARGYQLVAGDFLGRYKTLILIKNDDELVELYYVLASGLIGTRGYKKSANHLLDKIRDRVSEINPYVVKVWPYQDGR